jgi:uncharacterized protein YndB with AHSA1/START domain
MNSASVPEDTIGQQVEIHAPAARVFAALTDPRELLRWWNWEGKFKLVHAESDLRPGGKWTMRVSSCIPGHPDAVVQGEYRIVEPPFLLSFTWNRDGEDHPETLVRWDLVENNGVTTARVTHSGLTTEHLRTRNSGWPMIVARLQTYLEG